MFKLYEIPQVYNNILELIEDEAVEPEEVEASLAQLTDNFDEKAENIVKILKSIEASATALKEEEDRLKERRRILENRTNSLKRYLEVNMHQMNRKKFKTNMFSFNIQKNAPSLRVLTEDFIPEEYYKVERKLQKRPLLDAIKNGQEVKGVQLVQSESLRIRYR